MFPENQQRVLVCVWDFAAVSSFSSMSSLLLLAMLLSVSCAAQVQTQDGANTLRLCGRAFLRAVVYTCGGSRWRRLMGGDDTLPDGQYTASAFRTFVLKPPNWTNLQNKSLDFCKSIHRQQGANFPQDDRCSSNDTSSAWRKPSTFNSVLSTRLSTEWPLYALLEGNVHKRSWSSRHSHSLKLRLKHCLNNVNSFSTMTKIKNTERWFWKESCFVSIHETK